MSSLNGEPPVIYTSRSGSVVLSGAIMAHPKRRAWAEGLSDQTGLPIVWDRVSLVWETATRAWRAHDPNATHHIVIQDDAVLCRDFIPTVLNLIEAAPLEPISLLVVDYRLHGQKYKYEEAVRRGDRLWRSWLSVTAIATILPTRDIEPMVEFGDTTMERVLHDDFKMREFYKQRGVKFVFPIPSLVQHRHQDENPSLLEGHDAKFPDRTSSTFIGLKRSPIDIDWSEETTHVATKTPFRNTKTGEVVHVDEWTKAAAHLDRHPRWERLYAPPKAADEPAPEPDPVERPPKYGAGSTKAAWEAYAHFIGIDTTGMTKSDIIGAVDGQ